jgi:5S rRNA maturation endonuclease (ribonuclease M5)
VILPQDGGQRITVSRIRDAAGRHVADHVREDKPDGDKECRWRQLDGTWGLNGTKLSELPLYGAEQVAAWSLDDLVVVVEGEKARAAMDRTDFFNVLGTVTGAAATPGAEALEVLRDRRVALWPDTDEQGRKHMERIADRLLPIAAEVLVYEWRDAPVVKRPDGKFKAQDAADHPAIQRGNQKALDRLLTDLEGAPRWQPKKAQGLPGRVLLGEGIAGELEPPDELEPGILLKGKVHNVYAAAGTGKTMLMLWAVKRCLERGQAVIVLDMENGPRTISERLRDLGVDAKRADELLHYFPSPNLPLTDEVRTSYEELLDEIKPALVVFDSWINFLASAGMDENSSNDVAGWAVAYTHPARNRGITVLLLDHVPHEGSHARGSTRKKDEVDVMWRLHNTQPFDRDSVGEIVLHREKDREAWLPPSVRFSVGGSSQGFVFKRSAGTIEETAEGELTDRQKQALDALRVFGERGAKYSEWQRVSGLKGTTFDRAISALTVRGLVRKSEGKYYPRTPPNGNGTGGGLTSTLTPTEPPRAEEAESGLFTGKADNPHVPPSNPHSENGGSGDYNPHNPHTLKGGGDGGNSDFAVSGSKRRLTADEGNERVQHLIDEGMRPDLAVAEVLGED